MVLEVEPGSALDAQVHLPGFELDHDVRAKIRSHEPPNNATLYSSMFSLSSWP